MNTVTVRDITFGDGQPKICIPITARTEAELLEQTERIRKTPCQMAEWRMDFYQESEQGDWIEHALELLRNRLGSIVLLATFRTKGEGGEKSISLQEYRSLNLRLAESTEVDLIDLELNRGAELVMDLTKEIHALGKKVIGSYHDFEKTPDQERMIQILCKMQELNVDITKAALMPNTEQDVLQVLGASEAMKRVYADRPFITMSMGRLGGISRLCGSLTGSAVTFATAGRASAPGQLDAQLAAQVLQALEM